MDSPMPDPTPERVAELSDCDVQFLLNICENLLTKDYVPRVVEIGAAACRDLQRQRLEIIGLSAENRERGDLILSQRAALAEKDALLRECWPVVRDQMDYLAATERAMGITEDALPGLRALLTRLRAALPAEEADDDAAE